MNYVLGLLFNYSHYKNNGRIRIFADEHFVEEVILDKDIKDGIKRGGNELLIEEHGLEWNKTYPSMYKRLQIKKEYDYNENAIKIKDELNETEKKRFDFKKRLDRINQITKSKQDKGRPKPKPTDVCHIYRHPEKLFLFDINEDFLKSNIRIECVNDNNNYSNGFMSKFSYIDFKAIFLMPVTLLKSKNILHTFRRLWKNGLLGGYTEQALEEFGYFYEQNVWPIAMNGITTQHKGKIRNIYHGIIGGSFEINIPLYKKHKITMCGRKDKAVGRILFNPEIIDIIMNYNLLNIYNENQRSNSKRTSHSRRH